MGIGKFKFGAQHYSVNEGEFLEIPILRFSDSNDPEEVMRAINTPQKVRFCTSSRTATELDYRPIDEVIYFAAGEDCKKVRVEALKDYLTEPDEHFTIQLIAEQLYTLGYPNRATITIKDMPR